MSAQIPKLSAGCLYGEVVSKREIANCILMETAHRCGHLPRHAHENSYFCQVLQGTYTEWYRQRNVLCEPSTISFRPAGEAHEDWLHGNVRVFVLEILPVWTQRLRELSLSLENAIDYRGALLGELSVKLNREFHRTDTASILVIEGLLLEIVAEATRQRSGKKVARIPGWLGQARDLILQGYSEKLTISKIADEVGIHPVHLAVLFKQKYGCTIGEFIRQLRIEHARKELANPEPSLTSIALAAGFSDHSHFSKVFRSYTGVTPSEYRQQLRPKRKTIS